jgi:hypothetical protein
MKKNTFTLALACVFAFSLSTNTFADEGQIPTMGKNCPANTVCRTDTQVSTSETSEKTDDTIFEFVLGYLSELLD